MFTMTELWLIEFYGSSSQVEVESTVKWLNQYGIDVPEDAIDLWSQFRHLSEYQVNTLDIVMQCLERVGNIFRSELAAHAWVNSLRVPGASEVYKIALGRIKPKSILELGVGGDSAISTSIFLDYLEQQEGGLLVSVDRNPLGMTEHRYKKYAQRRDDVGHPPLWTFIQADSVVTLNDTFKIGVRFDMVFIDTIHSYTHTYKELDIAQNITDSILMDDCGFEGNDFDDVPGGVKEAIRDWKGRHTKWSYSECEGKNVGVLTRNGT